MSSEFYIGKVQFQENSKKQTKYSLSNCLNENYLLEINNIIFEQTFVFSCLERGNHSIYLDQLVHKNTGVSSAINYSTADATNIWSRPRKPLCFFEQNNQQSPIRRGGCWLSPFWNFKTYTPP